MYKQLLQAATIKLFKIYLQFHKLCTSSAVQFSLTPHYHPQFWTIVWFPIKINQMILTQEGFKVR